MTPKNVVDLRKRLKWSQQKLADTLNVSLRTVQVIESGKKAIRAVHAKALQQVAQENPEKSEARSLKMELDFHGLIKILAGHLYSKKEIFVREIIQNSHDAVWRRHHADEAFDVSHGRIDIVTDMTSGAGRMVFRDNGIGMRDSDLVEELSAIGRSGTRAAQGEAPEVIGQFGIGFLSGFVVAGRIEVRSRHYTAQPEQGCLWSSDGDQDYSIEPVTLDKVGTEVTIYLKDATDRGVLQDDTLRKIITIYADMLKVAIHLNDPQHIRPPANLRLMPWERDGLSEGELRLENMIYLEKQVPDSVLEVIPVNEPDVQGLLYITKTRVIGRDAPRTVRVFLKRMFLCEGADELLPRWASFVNGLLNTTELEPNAARDKYMEDEKFTALREKLGNLIIAHLEGLKETDPTRLSEIMAYHDFGIKAACHYYDEFHEKFAHLLEWRVNPGSPLLSDDFGNHRAGQEWQGTERWATLPDLLAKIPALADGGPKRLSCFTSHTSARQYFDMADAAGTTVIDASIAFEGELLKEWAKSHESEVSFIHVDRQDDPAVFRDIDPADDGPVRELAQFISSSMVVGNARIKVEARRFNPDSVTSVLRDSERSESLQKAQSMLNDPTVSASLKKMAEDLMRMSRNSDMRMFINADNALVRSLAELVRADAHNDDAREISLGLYNSAILANSRGIDPNNATIFSGQYQRMMQRILDLSVHGEELKHQAEALRAQEEAFRQRQVAAQPAQMSRRKHLKGFHITRFAPEFNEIRRTMRSIMEEEFYCELVSADQQKLNPWINQSVRQHIEDADFFVVDLSDPISPNVLIETGAVGYGRPDAPTFYIAEVVETGAKPELPVDIEGLIVHTYVKSSDDVEQRKSIKEALRADGAFENMLSDSGYERYISPTVLNRLTVNIISQSEAQVALAKRFPTMADWKASEAVAIEEILRPHGLEAISSAVRKLVVDSAGQRGE